ncbi:flagellar operon protein [Selenomonas sp. GACV-9]|uniref:TIGR02530 family flagellar biosynthesis protein n=1 Tax=Selenomonas sp. GACV-9 TaxID=3158782 RepID=UPI0008E37045|nr:flagellar operon protein [Selenomonas ruminantium]
MAVSRMYLNTQPLLPLCQPASDKQQQVGKADFCGFLQEAQKDVNFSRHAADRLQERNIRLSNQDLVKLGDTVDRLARKGARESLIYMNDVALVVSVTNRTVITAMDGTSGNENIITNIDSAAIL